MYKTTIESTELQSIIESLLFVSGKSVALKEISQVTNASEDDVVFALERLNAGYKKDESRGLRLLVHAGSVELVTAGKNSLYIEKISGAEQKEPLSDASMETLAIIVYRGPLSKAAIDHLRGINSALILRNLLVRGYTEKVVAKTSEEMYQVTAEFLRQMGKDTVQDFPGYEEMNTQKLSTQSEIDV